MLAGVHGGGSCCSQALCPSTLPSTEVRIYHLQYHVTYRYCPFCPPAVQPYLLSLGSLCCACLRQGWVRSCELGLIGAALAALALVPSSEPSSDGSDLGYCDAPHCCSSAVHFSLIALFLFCGLHHVAVVKEYLRDNSLAKYGPKPEIATGSAASAGFSNGVHVH